MTSLPYSAAGFDVVLSLWTAFYELVEEDEQVAALREMSRVLRPAGMGIVEGSVYLPPTDTEMAAGVRRGPDVAQPQVRPARPPPVQFGAPSVSDEPRGTRPRRRASRTSSRPARARRG